MKKYIMNIIRFSLCEKRIEQVKLLVSFHWFIRLFMMATRLQIQHAAARTFKTGFLVVTS